MWVFMFLYYVVFGIIDCCDLGVGFFGGEEVYVVFGFGCQICVGCIGFEFRGSWVMVVFSLVRDVVFCFKGMNIVFVWLGLMYMRVNLV